KGSDENAVEKHSWSGPAFAKATARQEGLERLGKMVKHLTEAHEGNEERFFPPPPLENRHLGFFAVFSGIPSGAGISTRIAMFIEITPPLFSKPRTDVINLPFVGFSSS